MRRRVLGPCRIREAVIHDDQHPGPLDPDRLNGLEVAGKLRAAITGRDDHQLREMIGFAASA